MARRRVISSSRHAEPFAVQQLLTLVGAGGAVRASPVYRLRELGMRLGGFRSIGASTERVHPSFQIRRVHHVTHDDR